MTVYIGTVMSFGFDFAPKGWATCSGQLMSIAQNQALFSLLGTAFGGDGRTTFGLPNLQGKTIVGSGVDTTGTNWQIGETAGTSTVTMSINQMPAHSHPATTTIAVAAYSDSGTTSNAGSDSLAVSTGVNVYTSEAPDSTLKAFPTNIVVQNTGGSQPFSNMSPYLTINYSIALYGLFPSRN